MQQRKERRDSLENRRVILQSAQKLFALHGIDNVSMRQIAQSAGIGQGTLYRRYAHKGELCLDIMQDISRRIFDEINNYLKEAEKQTIRQKLEVTIKYLLEFVEMQSHSISAIKEHSCKNNMAVFFNSSLYISLHSILSEQIKQVYEQQSRSSVDTTYLVDAILAVMAPSLFMFQRRDRGYTTDYICEQIYRVFLDPLFSDHNDKGIKND